MLVFKLNLVGGFASAGGHYSKITIAVNRMKKMVFPSDDEGVDDEGEDITKALFQP